MKTILTPIDFSGVSEAVVAEAVALARALSGRVVLLTVVQPPAITSEYAPLLDNLVEIAAAGERAAARKLAKIEEGLREKSVAVEAVQRNGAPVAQILEQAEDLAADYIVMGSHGHTAFYDLLVGGTTHGVIMRARCPVVIVPPPKKRSRLREEVNRGEKKHRARTVAKAA